MLKDMGIDENVKRQDIYTTVVGINHFTWLTRATWKGMDLFPMYAEFAKKYADGYSKGKDENWMNKSFECAHRVKFDLFNR